MKRILFTLFLFCAFQAMVTAQTNHGTSYEVQLCATLTEILELRCEPDNSDVINLNIETKDHWLYGRESADYNSLSVCATTDWKLMCEVVGSTGDYIDELGGNGGQLPLACIGKKFIWQGTNTITNAFNMTQPLATGSIMALSPPPAGSNVGDFAANHFIIWWGLGQWQLPNMPDESLLDKQVKAGQYKVKVVYTLMPAN